MILEKDVTPEILSTELLSLIVDQKSRETMGRLGGTLAKPEAAKIIVDHCLLMLSH